MSRFSDARRSRCAEAQDGLTTVCASRTSRPSVDAHGLDQVVVEPARHASARSPALRIRSTRSIACADSAIPQRGGEAYLDGSARRGRLDAHRAIVHLDQAADDRKAKPEPSRRSSERSPWTRWPKIHRGRPISAAAAEVDSARCARPRGQLLAVLPGRRTRSFSMAWPC